MVDHNLGLQELDLSQGNGEVCLKLLDDYHSSYFLFYMFLFLLGAYKNLISELAVWLKFETDLLRLSLMNTVHFILLVCFALV